MGRIFPLLLQGYPKRLPLRLLVADAASGAAFDFFLDRPNYFPWCLFDLLPPRCTASSPVEKKKTKKIHNPKIPRRACGESIRGISSIPHCAIALTKGRLFRGAATIRCRSSHAKVGKWGKPRWRSASIPNGSVPPQTHRFVGRALPLRGSLFEVEYASIHVVSTRIAGGAAPAEACGWGFGRCSGLQHPPSGGPWPFFPGVLTRLSIPMRRWFPLPTAAIPMESVVPPLISHGQLLSLNLAA